MGPVAAGAQRQGSLGRAPTRVTVPVVRPWGRPRAASAAARRPERQGAVAPRQEAAHAGPQGPDLGFQRGQRGSQDKGGAAPASSVDQRFRPLLVVQVNPSLDRLVLSSDSDGDRSGAKALGDVIEGQEALSGSLMRRMDSEES